MCGKTLWRKVSITQRDRRGRGLFTCQDLLAWEAKGQIFYHLLYFDTKVSTARFSSFSSSNRDVDFSFCQKHSLKNAWETIPVKMLINILTYSFVSAKVQVHHQKEFHSTVKIYIHGNIYWWFLIFCCTFRVKFWPQLNYLCCVLKKKTFWQLVGGRIQSLCWQNLLFCPPSKAPKPPP